MNHDVLFYRLVDVIEKDILPLTVRGMTIGNKIYGAAILRKKDLSLVVSGTNHEAFSPLWHGEIYTMKLFYELQGHPDPSDCIFIATHEPCVMCTSAIAMAGFQQIFYLFDYERTGDTLFTPRGLKILREVFNCDAPVKKNSFFTIVSLTNMIEGLENKDLGKTKTEKIKKIYKNLEAAYYVGEGSCK